MGRKSIVISGESNSVGRAIGRAVQPAIHEAADAAEVAVSHKIDHAERVIHDATRTAKNAITDVVRDAADESVFVVARTEVAVSRQIEHFFQLTSAAKDSVMARVAAVFAPCLLAYALHFYTSADRARENPFDFLEFATLLWASTSLLAFVVTLLHLRIHEKQIAREFLKWEFYLATLFGLVAFVVFVLTHTALG